MTEEDFKGYQFVIKVAIAEKLGGLPPETPPVPSRGSGMSFLKNAAKTVTVKSSQPGADGKVCYMRPYTW